MAEARLAREMREIAKRAPVGVGAEPVSLSNMLNWEGLILGPPGTPYQGGAYKIKMKFPSSYPAAPPEVYFVSEMFHPNIYSNGKVCMGILNSSKWSSNYDVVYVLQMLVNLLQSPGLASPANSEAADLYKNNRSQYDSRVKACAWKAHG